MIGSSQKAIEPIKLPTISMTLGDLIRTDQCYDAISKKTTELLASNFQRCKIELTILDLMTQCIKAFDPKLNVHPFGSAVYGLCGAKGNYNILVDTREYAQKMLQKFHFVFGNQHHLTIDNFCFTQGNRKNRRLCCYVRSISIFSLHAFMVALRCQPKSMRHVYKSHNYDLFTKYPALNAICGLIMMLV